MYSDAELLPFRYMRAAPPSTPPVSREVRRHVIREHKRTCRRACIATAPCACGRTVWIVCETCHAVLLAAITVGAETCTHFDAVMRGPS